MYNRPYEIAKFEHLRCLIKLADFYLALPVLSQSLTACLIPSPEFADELFSMENFKSSELLMAKLLRNKVLFKGAFILTVGTFDRDDINPFLAEDVSLLSLVQGHYIELCEDVMSIQQGLLKACCKSSYSIRQCEKSLDVNNSGTMNRMFYVNLLPML